MEIPWHLACRTRPSPTKRYSKTSAAFFYIESNFLRHFLVKLVEGLGQKVKSEKGATCYSARRDKCQADLHGLQQYSLPNTGPTQVKKPRNVCNLRQNKSTVFLIGGRSRRSDICCISGAPSGNPPPTPSERYDKPPFWSCER